MSQEFSFKDIDVDGALAETAHDATEALESGDTRLSFFKKAGLAGGAAIGGGAMLSALVPEAALAFGGGKGPSRPPASVFGKGDIGILNFALTLEYLESAFYNEATKNQRNNAFISNPQTRTFLRTVTDDEKQHVAALKHVLGSKAAKKPKFHFNGDTNNEKRFVDKSFTFENEGVHAYSGQAFNISSPKVLAAALSIVTIEARHASVIGLIRNGSSFGIAPSGAFDKPLKAGQVLADVHSLKYGL